MPKLALSLPLQQELGSSQRLLWHMVAGNGDMGTEIKVPAAIQG